MALLKLCLVMTLCFCTFYLGRFVGAAHDKAITGNVQKAVEVYRQRAYSRWKNTSHDYDQNFWLKPDLTVHQEFMIYAGIAADMELLIHKSNGQVAIKDSDFSVR